MSVISAAAEVLFPVCGSQPRWNVRPLAKQEILDRRRGLADFYERCFRRPPNNQIWTIEEAAWHLRGAALLAAANSDTMALMRIWHDCFNSSRIFIVEAGQDRIVGMGAVEFLTEELMQVHGFDPKYRIGRGDAYQSVLCVDENYEGQGICSALFKEGIRFAQTGDPDTGLFGAPVFWIRTLIPVVRQMCLRHGCETAGEMVFEIGGIRKTRTLLKRDLSAAPSERVLH